jgi:N-acetylneuraminic acid mutarotase
MHAGSFVTGNTIYVMGGFQGNTVWSDAVQATVEQDGTVSAWTPAGQIAGPRSHFSVVQVGPYIYMAGGLNSSPEGTGSCLTDVSKGYLQSDGTFGPWAAMPSLPEPLCTQASFFYGGYLYIVGGIMENAVNAEESSAVFRSAVGADGTIGAWAKAPALPIARGHVHQVPMFENHVYSVGGAIDFDLDSTSQLDIGTFQ